MSTNTDASDFNLQTNWGTFGARLRWARKRARLTQEQVCALVGMTQGAYSSLETRGTGSEKTASLSKVLRVDAVWLESGDGEPEVPEDQHESYVEIRVVDLKLSAGIVGFSVEYSGEDVEPIMFRRSWLFQKGYKAERLFATKIKGPSMENTLFDRDLVVFNTADTEPSDGEVYAVNYDGEPIIKRLVKDAGQWWLDSDNQDKVRFPRKVFTSTSSIVGRVILKQSERI